MLKNNLSGQGLGAKRRESDMHNTFSVTFLQTTVPKRVVKKKREEKYLPWRKVEVGMSEGEKLGRFTHS